MVYLWFLIRTSKRPVAMKNAHFSAECVTNVSGTSAIWNTIFAPTQERSHTFVTCAANRSPSLLCCCATSGEFTPTRDPSNAPNAPNRSSRTRRWRNTMNDTECPLSYSHRRWTAQLTNLSYVLLRIRNKTKNSVLVLKAAESKSSYALWKDWIFIYLFRLVRVL